MLTAHDIRVTLGRSQILKGVNFTAEPGEITAIVGPNGSGKTTLLKAMTGDVPFTGEVSINGDPVGSLTPWDLAAIRGVLPQSSTLAFPFRAAEVVRIGLSHGQSGNEARIVMQALSRVGLADKARSFYQELSGGEQHRVQLARVLAQIWEPVSATGEPRWLFLDEPVSSLDIAHQLEVMDIAAGFAADGGGVVAVMHDLNLTSMYAASVAVMAEGGVLCQGASRDVLTDDVLSHAYGCKVEVSRAPAPGEIFILPQMSRRL